MVHLLLVPVSGIGIFNVGGGIGATMDSRICLQFAQAAVISDFTLLIAGLGIPAIRRIL
jgi:hypothetical protein